eukprot:TRINITY_DN91843_c0_g1_i1.p1 TRINITY_DN91843_c0_g1~~TRINITY_DN91843_c0_g1_i1.p1  ORF type:complete len:419 (-),score=64.87 TRINITY_DN91843_c0_g1_i1:327-1475(-)
MACACWRAVWRLVGYDSAPSKDSCLDASMHCGSQFNEHNPSDVLECYELDSEPLGQGTFGVVFKGRHLMRPECIRAVKVAPKTAGAWDEVLLMASLDHPNVVKLLETFEDKEHVYAVQELCEGGDLFDRCIEEGCLEESQARPLMTQVLHAVHYIHSKGVCHRDLKPENFLLTSAGLLNEAELKLIDFGCASRWFPGKVMHTVAGTAAYMAPEVFDGRYQEFVDEWSAGVMLFAMLLGDQPFHGLQGESEIGRPSASNFNLSFPECHSISEEAKDVIRRLLTIKADERCRAGEALELAWFRLLGQVDLEFAGKASQGHAETSHSAVNVAGFFKCVADVRHDIADTLTDLRRVTVSLGWPQQDCKLLDGGAKAEWPFCRSFSF